MSWFSDAVDAVGDAVSDVVETVVDVVETVVAPVADVVETVAETVFDIGSTVFDTVTALPGMVFDTVTALPGAIIDFVPDIVEFATEVPAAIIGAAGTVADWGLTAIDTMVFDPVDYLTGGIVDVDYDDGQIEASVGISGIAEVGVSVGTHGVGGYIDTALADANASIGENGLALGASVGVDAFPFPYLEGHVELGTDGSVSIGGEAQGSLILPGAIVGGEVSGGLERDEDGSWMVHEEAEGTVAVITGTVITAGQHAEVSGQGLGDIDVDAGIDVGFTQAGLGHGAMQLGDEAPTIDDLDVDAFTLHDASGAPSAEFENQQAVVAALAATGDLSVAISAATTSGAVSVAAAATSAAVSVAEGATGVAVAAAGAVTGVAVAGAEAAADAIDVLAQAATDGTFDDFTSDIVSAEVVEAAADELWDDLDTP